jgi:hypothetical protein
MKVGPPGPAAVAGSLGFRSMKPKKIIFLELMANTVVQLPTVMVDDRM